MGRAKGTLCTRETSWHRCGNFNSVARLTGVFCSFTITVMYDIVLGLPPRRPLGRLCLCEGGSHGPYPGMGLGEVS
jgi:hypothetical protein